MDHGPRYPPELVDIPVCQTFIQAQRLNYFRGLSYFSLLIGEEEEACILKLIVYYTAT